jgi:hypothetical protein
MSCGRISTLILKVPFRCKLHQHFMHASLYESLHKAFCAYTLGLSFLGARILAQMRNVGEIDHRCKLHQNILNSYLNYMLLLSDLSYLIV